MRPSCVARADSESVAALSRLRETHSLQTTGVAKMRGMSSTEAPPPAVILREEIVAARAARSLLCS